MIVRINYHNVTSNIREAFDYLDHLDYDNSGSLGVFNFKQVLRLRDKYPNIFQPLYYLQTQIKNHTLGWYWWNQHKIEIYETKQEEIVMEMKKKQQEAKLREEADHMFNERMLKIRMGWKYYGMPWLRNKELKRMLRIAAIEAELHKGLNI